MGAVQLQLDLDGRQAAAVQHLARLQLCDRRGFGHIWILAWLWRVDLRLLVDGLTVAGLAVTLGHLAEQVLLGLDQVREQQPTGGVRVA